MPAAHQCLGRPTCVQYFMFTCSRMVYLRRREMGATTSSGPRVLCFMFFCNTMDEQETFWLQWTAQKNGPWSRTKSGTSYFSTEKRRWASSNFEVQGTWHSPVLPFQGSTDAHFSFLTTAHSPTCVNQGMPGGRRSCVDGEIVRTRSKQRCRPWLTKKLMGYTCLWCCLRLQGLARKSSSHRQP